MKNLLMEEKTMKLPTEEFEKKGENFLNDYRGKSFNVEVEGMEYKNAVLTDVVLLGLDVKGNEKEMILRPMYGLSFTGGVDLITPMITKMTLVTPKKDKHYEDLIDGCKKQFRANVEASRDISGNEVDIISKCIDNFNKLKERVLGKRVKLNLVYGIEFIGIITDMKIDGIVNGTCIIEYKINGKETIKSDKIKNFEILI